ncbi:MAG: hypothetical protein K9J06_02040 [Flavobacteriales bacterium]|nr:hypothetical protein [Flavobacteriales bacterium]
MRSSAFLLTLFLLAANLSAMADIGTRHLLLHTRATLHEELDRLASDSSAIAALQADSVKAALIALDGEIFASYDETLARLSAQQRRRSTDDRELTVFALLCCLIALGSIFALWLAHARISTEQHSGLWKLYRQLFSDFILTVRPDKAASPALTRISPVVILGILGMMLSVVVYLLSSLR